MNRGTDVPVGSTPANVAAHGLVDIGIARLRFLGEQRGRAHDLSGLAVTTLRNVVFDPRLLHWMAAVNRETFNSNDGFSGHTLNRRHAGADDVAVDVYGARSAHGHAAAKLGASHAEFVSENPKQRHFGNRIDCLRFPV